MALPTNLTKPYTMVGATTANASDVNADLDYITTALNATNLLLNQSAGTTTDLTARLAVTQNNDGTLKTLGAVGLTGNLTFSGTSPRIVGDMTTTPRTLRLCFQTSTTNGVTTITVIPNGTATTGALRCANSSDPDNASSAVISSGATDINVQSVADGTGVYLPMRFVADNAEVLRFTASGTTTPAGASRVKWTGIPSYADNAAALSGGLTSGMMYHTSGTLKIVT